MVSLALHKQWKQNHFFLLSQRIKTKPPVSLKVTNYTQFFYGLKQIQSGCFTPVSWFCSKLTISLFQLTNMRLVKSKRQTCLRNREEEEEVANAQAML